jgi:hypothetical protein
MHVDDGCLIADSTELRDQFLTEIRGIYNLTVDYDAKRFLGMDIRRERSSGTLTLSQSRYVDVILQTAGMEECNATKCKTPMLSKQYLNKIEETPANLKDYPYRVLLGQLMWLTCTTRYDISYAVTYLAQFCNAYDETHIQALKRIIRYLKATKDVNLIYHRDYSADLSNIDKFIVAWSDADFASDPVTRRSVTGSLVTFNNSAIFGRSVRQKSVQLSTQASELIALSETARRVEYIRLLLKDLYPSHDPAPTYLMGDNQASLIAATSNTVSTTVKHIAIRDRYIKEKVQEGTIITDYCPTNLMLADIFTKALDDKQHWILTKIIQGLDIHQEYFAKH